jgi:hypothetical protein
MKLTTQFVIDHIDEQFMIGINALYWLGTLRASMNSILEEFPPFSESFYRRYGTFSPLNPDLAIREIYEEKCSIRYLDASIKWEDFVIDVIGFFHHSKCLHEMKRIIMKKFLDHYETIASVDDTKQETVAKKILDEYNDTRMLILFEFRDYLWGWDSSDSDDMV